MRPQETAYLEVFKKQCEETLGWGGSEAWSNADFEKLSELVFEKTGVNLSISTLKRVWGKVKYDSAPTATTLNTLAQFSGYESWRSFCAQARLNGINNHIVPIIAVVDNPVRVKTRRPINWIFAAVALILIPTLIWMSFFKNAAMDVNRAKVIFTSKPVSDELPNSVVFNYDAGKIHADSVIIQQSWDPRRRETVSSREHQHTSIYYYPGFFKAKLLVNNQIVSEHGILIKTNGWKGIIEQPDKPVYLSDNEIREENGVMKITAPTLTAKTGHSVFNETWTDFFNVREFNDIDPGNFELNAVLQNTSAKEEAICQQVKINIMTSNGFVSLHLCAKGCTSAIALNVADTFISGKDHDLSALGCDFSKAQKFKLTVKNKKAVIYLHQKPVYTVSFTKPLGNVVGLLIAFEGTGEIEKVAIH